MNIDNVLIFLGMGRYQFVGCILFGLMIMYSNVSPVAYIFTASDLKYRCEIPECDIPITEKRIYNPDWLRFSTPYRDTGSPRKCQRFAVKKDQGNHTRCEPGDFDKNTMEWCQDNWVFEDPEKTIGTEFGLMCEENKWKLSMVGSVNNIGQLVGIPMSGIISDKYGRKFAMIFCAVTSAVISIVQSFSINYLMFLGLEFLSSTASSGSYAVTFVLAMELVLPKYRVIYYSILECFLPIGSVLVALVASQVKDWRLLLRISNIPGLLFLSYFWLTEESVRWLEIQGEHDKVNDVLLKIAGMNKRSLHDFRQKTNLESKNQVEDNDVKVRTSILKDIFRSSSIFWRMIRCSFLWITATLVYFGLNIRSTDIAGNKYVNFTLVSLVEIPACLFTWAIMEYMSRKMSLFYMFMLSGATCVMYNLTPDNLGLIMKLTIFMISKLAISIAFCIIYVQTAEIFPTPMRSTMLSLCSMFGRIGSILAPQITLLTEYFGEYTAMFMMGTFSLVAAAITMTLPESKNVKLPDTIDEAERIGNDLSQKNTDRSV